MDATSLRPARAAGRRSRAATRRLERTAGGPAFFADWLRALFRIAHAPWPLAPVEVERFEGVLVGAAGSWWSRARPAGGHFSPGVEAVRIGPCRVAHLHPHPAAPREFLSRLP